MTGLENADRGRRSLANLEFAALLGQVPSNHHKLGRKATVQTTEIAGPEANDHLAAIIVRNQAKNLIGKSQNVRLFHTRMAEAHTENVPVAFTLDRGMTRRACHDLFLTYKSPAV